MKYSLKKLKRKRRKGGKRVGGTFLKEGIDSACLVGGEGSATLRLAHVVGASSTSAFHSCPQVSPPGPAAQFTDEKTEPSRLSGSRWQRQRRKPHLITCIHLAHDRSPERASWFEGESTERAEGMSSRAGVQRPQTGWAAIFVESVLFVLKEKMKHLIHEKGAFRDNVGSRLRKFPNLAELGAEGRCWKDHVCDEFHAQLFLISDVTGPCINLETHHLPVASSAGTVVLISPARTVVFMVDGLHLEFDLWSSPWRCCVLSSCFCWSG